MRRGEVVEHVSIHQRNGTMRVPVITTEIPGVVLTYLAGHGWSVTHARSGWNIGALNHRLEAAIGFVPMLRGHNWDRSRTAVLKDGGCITAARAMREAGA